MAKNLRKQSALDLIRKVTDEVSKIRPTREEMLGEIKMMSFKVRSVSGDIFEAASRDPGFIESLWKIGKIEEIISSEMHLLDNNEKEMVFRFLDDLEFSAKERINSAIQSLSPEEQEKVKIFKLEIFRERKLKKDLN